MKFVAMLKDSLREAIDAKVFYVMVGLSLLMILVALSAAFTPADGGEMVMKMAAVPLSVDLANLDVGGFGPDRSPDPGDGPDPTNLLRHVRGAYEVKEVHPLDGQPDRPDSIFRVVVRPMRVGLAAIFAPKPETVMRQIRERFGEWGDAPIAEVLDVTHEKGDYRIDARLTEAGRRMWPHSFSLFFGALPVRDVKVPLGMQLFFVEGVLVNGIGAWVAVLISVVITAFFIPNMLRKGTIDLLLVKPMRRPTLLLYKYVGGLLFIFLNTTIAVGGVWLALSLRSGIWAPGFLLAIPVITFFFAVLYSVSALFGVLTRSPIVSILMTIGVWFFLFLVGTIHLQVQAFEKIEQTQARRRGGRAAAAAVGVAAGPGGPLAAAAVLEHAGGPEPGSSGWRVFRQVVRVLHFVLPRTKDLDTLMTAVLERDLMGLPRGLGSRGMVKRELSWGESLTVSGAFIALMLGLSCWWFATRDY